MMKMPINDLNCSNQLKAMETVLIVFLSRTRVKFPAIFSGEFGGVNLVINLDHLVLTSAKALFMDNCFIITLS